MKYTEELLWILDKDGVKLKGDAEYQENIAFVHSLGLKCDCVGWSRLKLADPGTEEILDAIEGFCRKNGWKARGLYFRDYPETERDWYELTPGEIKEATEADRPVVETGDGGSLKLANLRAYHETSSGPKRWMEEILVSERFREACLRHGIPGAEFCWARDVGKYAAGQYFYLYGTQRISRIAVDRELRLENREKIKELGGWLPRIAEIFYRLQQINLQDCYLASDLPAGGVACAYCPRTFSYCGRRKMLIHKDAAALLIREKAIAPAALRPAAVVETLPGGYTLDETQVKPRPTADYMARALAEYEALKAAPRPVRQVSEKDALKVLRAAKRERKADFGKAMPKARAEALGQTPYAPMRPYYLVVSGGYLSDEYELLPWDRTQECDGEFRVQMAAEELLESKPEGVVIAKCPDGDTVLLCADGSVVRFSHEMPEAIGQWPTLAQFIFDTVTEQE